MGVRALYSMRGAEPARKGAFMRPTILGLILLTAACGVTPLLGDPTPYQDGPMPDQGVRVSNPEVCRVYVMRESRALLRSAILKVYFDGKRIGAIDNDTFLCVEVESGTVPARVELHPKGQKETHGKELLACAADDVLYCFVRFATGTAWPKIEFLDENDGKDELAKRQPAPVR
jgi:hypothetical protein